MYDIPFTVWVRQSVLCHNDNIWIIDQKIMSKCQNKQCVESIQCDQMAKWTFIIWMWILNLCTDMLCHNDYHCEMYIGMWFVERRNNYQGMGSTNWVVITKICMWNLGTLLTLLVLLVYLDVYTLHLYLWQSYDAMMKVSTIF